MRDAAAKIRIPALAMVARNDKTTKAVEAVAQEMKSRGAPVHLIVYPDYAPLGAPRGIPPGHLLFTAAGAKFWRDDVLSFLARLFAPK
jgi:dienelactone hydrolase